MDITNKLRRYVSGPAKSGISPVCEKVILNIADDIDMELVKRYLLLPLDADCVPVCREDMMVDEFGHVFRVDGYKWYEDRWWIFQDTSIQAPAEHCTHWHPPTVESLLKEFGEEWSATLEDYEMDLLIAEYAAKIRLAGDGE